MPEHGAVPSGEEQAQGKARWRQSDVKRAISAAGQAGLQNYRIEIGPDGTIAIVVLPTLSADEPDASEQPVGAAIHFAASDPAGRTRGIRQEQILRH